jgi:cobaltochelatase CobN
MHLLVRDSQTLDGDAPAVELGHTPADLVFLSFSDSDLGAAATAWAASGGARPSLRLANLALLRHPMSVDLYAEQILSRARCVVIRLLGGLDYWRYGAEEAFATCSAAGVALLLVPGDGPGDGPGDPRLAALSTVPAASLAAMAAYLRIGGPDNMAAALALAAHLGGLGPAPSAPPAAVPAAGEHDFGTARSGGRLAVLVFYRSHLLAGDIASFAALAEALAARGMAMRAVYVSSLKDPEAAAFIEACLRDWRPAVVLNATLFSARRDAGGSPLDAAGVPVLQLVLAVGGRDAWAAGWRGLSQTDLAMQVVLPELDGRLLTTAISFKDAADEIPGLQFQRTINRPDPAGIALAADRACGWVRLAETRRRHRHIAVMLSDYPGAGAGAGGGQLAHAVGLDSFASLAAITRLLDGAGYDVPADVDAATLATRLSTCPAIPILDVACYRRLFAALPESTQRSVIAAWGDPEHDPCVADGWFTLRHLRLGRLLVAIQPDRGARLDRKAGYHDADTPPRHGYIACYLWLSAVEAVHALLHLGTHGTLEWLPGKSVALSDACLPTALLRGLPVIYPFIVNNPGEAAAAKRRLGAVTIGHMTPPLATAAAHGPALVLERLIDEYASADGLDRRRGALLRRDILTRAAETGLLAEAGVADDPDEDAALARLDAYLCDVKELQIRDGLHVFATAPRGRAALLARLCASAPGTPEASLRAALDACAAAEAEGLLAALDGHLVQPGPSGAPTRGRADVLPTGRNLFTVDPRAVPTPSALALAERTASDLLRRHSQDQGDWLRSAVIDLWGTASMRTGGEDFALALVLLGVRPVWDDGSARLSGFEILPLALLDRPRVDVTLRISGLFRDAFETQIALFDSAVRAVAARDEAPDWNPLAHAARGLEGAALRAATTRVFGAAPGTYGAGVGELVGRGAWQARDELGAAYVAASSSAYGHGLDGIADAAGFTARVADAGAFVHQQDHAETDLLDDPEYAAHEGGFAAAAAALGATPALYHTDISRPGAPRTRTLAEEVARVVRGRAANPAWIRGMLPHGFRGAAEIARAVDALHGFAATLPERFDRQFDLLFDATLGDPEIDAFLRAANPAAHAAMLARFEEARGRGLWRTGRNMLGDPS